MMGLVSPASHIAKMRNLKQSLFDLSPSFWPPPPTHAPSLNLFNPIGQLPCHTTSLAPTCIDLSYERERYHGTNFMQEDGWEPSQLSFKLSWSLLLSKFVTKWHWKKNVSFNCNPSVTRSPTAHSSSRRLQPTTSAVKSLWELFFRRTLIGSF